MEIEREGYKMESGRSEVRRLRETGVKNGRKEVMWFTWKQHEDNGD